MNEDTLFPGKEEETKIDWDIFDFAQELGRDFAILPMFPELGQEGNWEYTRLSICTRKLLLQSLARC